MASYKATWFDGRGAVPIPVTVTVDRAGIHLIDERSAALPTWPTGKLRLVEEVYPGRPVRLMRLDKPNERLVVEDHAFLDDLGRYNRAVRGRDMRRSSAGRRIAFWTGGVVAALVALYFGLPYMASGVAKIVPVSWEERLGRTVRDTALTVFSGSGGPKYCTGSAGRAALDRLTARLKATVDTPYTFRVEVVDSSLVNAMAAPGGYIVIFRGLIDRAKSAEEVAGVLAHEMAHVTEQHSTTALIRLIGTQLVLTAFFGDMSAVLSGYGAELMTYAYTREAEQEADTVGVAMLNRAGIRGDGLAAFFQRFSAAGVGKRAGVRSWYSTHPAPGDRAKRVRAAAKGTGRALEPAEWQALQNICRTTRGG